MKTYRIPVERIKISDDWKTATVTISPDDQPMIEATQVPNAYKLGPVASSSIYVATQICVKLLPPDRAVMQCLTFSGEYFQWIEGQNGPLEFQKINSELFGTFYNPAPVF